MPFVSMDRVAVGGISAGSRLTASFALLASCSNETDLSMEPPLRLFPKGFRLRSQYLLCASLNMSKWYRERLQAVPPGAVPQKSLPGFLASAMEDMYLSPPIDRNSPLVTSFPLHNTKRTYPACDEETKVSAISNCDNCELDCLKLEGEAYANKLEHCRVDVVYKEWPGGDPWLYTRVGNEEPDERSGDSKAVEA